MLQDQSIPRSTAQANVRLPEAVIQQTSSLKAAKQALARCRDLREVQMTIADYLRSNINAPLVAWYYPPGGQIGRDARIESLVCPTDGMNAALRQQLKQQGAEAVRTANICVKPLSGQDGLVAVACPLDEPSANCLVAILESDARVLTNSFEWLQLTLAVTLIEEWSARQCSEKVNSDASALAAIIELISRVHSAADAESACQRLADQLAEYLSADKVFVGLSRGPKAEPRLMSVSGEREFNRLADSTRLTEAVLHESTARSVAAIWPANDIQNRHALLSHQQLAEYLRCQNIVSVPLISESGNRAGAIIATFGSESTAVPQTVAPTATSVDSECTSDQEILSHDDTLPPLALAVEAERLLRAGSVPLTSCLEVVQRLADSRWIHAVRRGRELITRKKLRGAGMALGIFCATLLIPAPYQIRCKCELQPIERRYVAAPFAGPLEECLVEPGDLVEANQLLARMDAREIQWELAGVQADLHKANKERNTHLSTHEFGDAAIARHEVERLQTRSDLLQHRDTNLEIRSPISGLIVSGDHREAEGVPLDQGQTLFEVAPLHHMVVEVSIPEEDIRHVSDGMTIRVQLDAIPDRILEARLRRIHPRAELVDNENVFIAEAELKNDELQLRPGMRGAVKVISHRHTLGWNWFHKPFAHLVGWLGW